MVAELRERLLRQLIRHEGKRNSMYLDSKGIPTIGIGHNLRDKPISDAAVAQIYEDDITDAEREIEREIPWVVGLSLPRQGVIYDMVHNLGMAGFQRFVKMIAALIAERWEDAAYEMLDSDWAKQVGRRATRLAEQMRSGEWQT